MARPKKRVRVSRDDDETDSSHSCVEDEIQETTITISGKGKAPVRSVAYIQSVPSNLASNTPQTESPFVINLLDDGADFLHATEAVTDDEESEAPGAISNSETDYESDVHQNEGYGSNSEYSDKLESDVVSEGPDDAVTTGAASDKMERINLKTKKPLRIKKNTRWLPLRDEFLSELLYHESPPPPRTSCSICGIELTKSSARKMEFDAFQDVSSCEDYMEKQKWTVKCVDCMYSPVCCVDCIIECHKERPLHNIMRYTCNFWDKVTLRELGLVVHLCHEGDRCPSASNPQTVTVLHVGGYAQMNVTFCRCQEIDEDVVEERTQLMRARLYPATVLEPRTVATFEVLELYTELSYQGKISRYDFYRTLLRITDYADLHGHKNRYEEFCAMVRQFEHLKMLARGGRCLAEDGVAGTQNGELAVRCPACPHVKINLPKDWAERVNKWIYRMFVMVDANFRLKLKARGFSDEALSAGWAYFVDPVAYKKHLADHVDEPEMKYCSSGLKAVDHANLKGGRGYIASGVVAVQCRHMFILPNGIGDLQKGERHINVDFVLLCALCGMNILELVISYDIACQYHRNFKKRMATYPVEMWLSISIMLLVFVIPKFHLPGHGDSCQTKFSLNYRRHMARTDGENIERGWAHLNGLSPPTKEMSPGGRADTLNAHIGSWNMTLEVKQGKSLLKRLKDAEEEAGKQRIDHEDFKRSFSAKTVEELERRIDAWEMNTDIADNPYRENVQRKRFSDVQNEMREKARRDAVKDKKAADIYASATQWLVRGIELQEQQVRYRETKEDINSAVVLPSEGKYSWSAEEKNTTLWRNIVAWTGARKALMPAVPEEDFEEDGDSHSPPKAVRAADIKMIFPLSLSAMERAQMGIKDLSDAERQLREGQAGDALEDLRQCLQNKFIMQNKKHIHVSGPGQGPNTQSNRWIHEAEKKVDIAAEHYKSAWDALERLDPGGAWQKDLQFLKKEDIKPALRSEVKIGQGHVLVQQSWIWVKRDAALDGKRAKKVQTESEGGTAEEDIDEDDEMMKVELARSKARVERWEEEIVLVKEEMRRVLVFLRWKANNWIAKAHEYKCNIILINKGSICYANKQAWILRSMADKFEWMWTDGTAFRFDEEVSSMDYLDV